MEVPKIFPSTVNLGSIPKRGQNLKHQNTKNNKAMKNIINYLPVAGLIAIVLIGARFIYEVYLQNPNIF